MSGRWWAMVLVLALLVANNRLYLTEDRTGNWPAGAPVGKLGQPIPPEACAIWRNGSVRCVDCSDVRDSDRFIGHVSYYFRDHGSTFDPTTPIIEDAINCTVGGAAADPNAVRAAYTDWLAAHPDKFWQSAAARLTAQAAPGRNIRWRAVFRFFTNALLTLLLIRSLAWTLPILDSMGRGLSKASMTPAERAALRRKKALAAGECPSCGYDIRGLPVRVCPECAHRWNEAEARSVPHKPPQRVH